MKPDENEVKLKNAELTLASIKEDTRKEAEILTALLEGKFETQTQVSEMKAELEKERSAIAEERAVLASERADNVRIKEDAGKAVLRAEAELKVIVSQKNEAMKELSHLNEWNMKAEDEKKGLEASIESLKLQEQDRRELVADIESLKTDKKEADNALRQVKLETALLIDETTGKVKSLEKEGELAVARLVEAQEARGKAEVELYDLHNEKARIRRDLDVCIDRVEKKYGEAFPELRMKI